MPVILEKWNNLINNTINPYGQLPILINEEVVKNLIIQSKVERDAIKNLLIEDVVNRQKIIDKQEYVQIIQGMLIRLLDRLHLYQQNENLESLYLFLYNSLSQHLQNVLDFIEDFFSKYFDRNEKIPASYLLISITDLRKQLHQLEQGLILNNINNELADILINNYRTFCSIKATAPTYNQLLYQKDLISELLSDNVLTSEKSITDVLFYLNFNQHNFVAYLFDSLKNIAEDYESNNEKIAALRYKQKTINQVTSRLNCYFLPNLPSLKEQVNTWIEEEIKFLQAESTISLPTKAAMEDEDKIQTSLSVSKLALLVRLMVIDKVITNRVVAQVLRVVIRTVATTQAVNIGFSSFESKYHKTDKGTISSVKDMLFRWINILNQL